MPGPVELKNKRMLVVGVARTGIATAQFCAARGAIVTATDSRSEAEIGDAAGKLREAGVKLALGGHDKNIFVQQDLIVPSPGVPTDSPLLQAAHASGAAIWSEIELAYRFRKGKLIGITGSNGKNNHHFSCRAYLAVGIIPYDSGRQHRHSVDFLRRAHDPRHGHRCGAEQFPTRAHSGIPHRHQCVPQSNSGSFRSAPYGGALRQS